MSELVERLQEALGTAYKIERELGGGGMSHVFVARETALGRSVVVKVLPPETAAAVNIERFRREIQLVASLQHPHIVPVHSAGQAGDLFYYTMPLVEGESLRAKLARESELPVGDAIRILRDVVDALAYAHARGVVHRDIKPDNVLISGQHAVVTDFGVAKAMSAASGSSTLTSLGVALGTPAYMAPEQAAADPNVDHRADLYAVGAMAYEMLCGRPPFSGMSPQQVLAAHVTLPPAPISAQRPSVPPALNALVMRCLEKKPADRIQTAAEMLTQLQAMATPSGGMAPTGAAPAFTSGAEAALRRAHPVRVAMLFTLVSVLVLAAVFVLRQRLGLPDWVFPMAAVLLVIGMPIMLATGRKERERVLAATTGTYRVPDVGVARHLTWRKAILGGALAFGSLALVVIVYTSMRVFGIGSVGTLQAKGLLKERQPILLAEFESHGRDSTLATTLTEAFRVDLSQSQSVKLIDGQAVSDGLARMQRAGTSVLTPALARELAVREGVPAVVTGTVDPVGKSYVISARVVSASNDAVLTAVRETAASDAELIPALDRLSRALRERIGESLVSIRADQPLEHVTTGSLDALRKYTEGIRLSDQGRDEDAVAPLQEAVTIDTGFAMAWRKLAVALNNSAATPAKVIDASTRAYRLRDRLPEVEKLAAAAWYYDLVEHDLTKEIAAYRALLAVDTGNTIALNNLAIALGNRREFAESETLARRCVELGVVTNCAGNALYAQMLQHKEAAADSTLAVWTRAAPDDPALANGRMMVAIVRHDYESANRISHALASAQASSPYWSSVTAEVIAATEEMQGKLARGEARMHEVIAMDSARGDAGFFVRRTAFLAQSAERHQVGTTEAMAMLARAVAKYPFASMDVSSRQYSMVAVAYALAGRPEDARRLMAEYAHEMPAIMQKGDPDRFAAAGEIAMAEGHYADALTNFRAWRVDNQCELCGTFEIGAAFAKLAQPDSARAYYEQYVTDGFLFRVYLDVDHLAAAYQRLGELYEAKGDRVRARDNYQKLADLWKDADPELQPIVRDAHERIARLSAEH